LDVILKKIKLIKYKRLSNSELQVNQLINYIDDFKIEYTPQKGYLLSPINLFAFFTKKSIGNRWNGF